MKKRNCYLFVFDGYSDWEPALTVAQLNIQSDFAIHTFSVDGKPIRSAGNIQVQPDHSLKELKAADIDLLIIPGGEVWEKGGGIPAIYPILREVILLGKTVAAICGATVGLASEGHLDQVAHTSNALPYLKQLAPGYKGDKHYKVESAVDDNNIITANGAASHEFMIAIFRHFGLLPNDVLDKVYDLYRSGGMDNKLF